MTRTRRLAISLALNAGLVVAQVALGLVARSTGLLADAGHNLTDVGALVLSMVAVRLALRPPNAERSFGNHRATILAALANASLIAVVTALIVAGSVHRLGHPEQVRAGVVVVVASLGLVVNGVAALVLRDGSSDLNMRSAVLHMVGDALASLAVVLAAVALLFVPSANWLDPVSALVVAAIIVFQAFRVLRGSITVLLESTPSDVDLADLTATMEGTPGVGEVHDLHVWSLSTEMRLLSAHMVLTGHPSLEEAQVVGERVKAAIASEFSISHSTLELECERCNEDDEDPCRMEAVAPVAGSLRRH
ncbi:MAG TPA: cation diffusion facilitator family transporter [Acidimicrobiales bacterium]|nr:cation diffusion facilitator family transporter [Acidimicrobiales bacterium]